MIQLDREIISNYRRKTFRTDPSFRVHSREEAVQFVNDRGFIFFWPITGFIFPSLWAATAGDRPVADEHDDPGHITWGWKDELLGQNQWFYGRVLARKNCMIALDVLPDFYALSPNYGDPENDYLEDYHRGLLPLEAKNVYEILLKEGPLDSITLRRAAHLSSNGSDSRFNRALEILQTSFRLVPVGVSTNGAWHYSFIYDLFHRHYNNAIERSHTISEKEAQIHILEKFFRSVGAGTIGEIAKLFRWDIERVKPVLDDLIKNGFIIDHVAIAGEKSEYFVLRQLIQATPE